LRLQILGMMRDRQTLSIKGMVCKRCITVLQQSLEKLSLSVEEIYLGKVTVSGLRSLSNMSELDAVLKPLNFEIFKSGDQKLIDQVKKIIDDFYSLETTVDKKVRFSTLLSEKLHVNYDALSALFSKCEGMTLEAYIINKRIDKIKEFLVYTDLTLAQIADLTGYSSMFHLSRQFKRVTSTTPSYFKQVKARKRQLIKEASRINSK